MKMDIIKRRQHYIPKTYLKQFATVGKSNNMIFAYFIKQKVNRFVSIDDVCVESYLYEHYICYNNGETEFVLPNSVENGYMRYENAYGKIVNTIINNCDNIISLTAEERSNLTEFMLSMLFRHPMFVNITNEIGEKMYNGQNDIRDDLTIKFPGIDDTYFKMMFLHLLLENAQDPKQCSMIRAMKKVCDEDQFCVFKSTKGEFITSDAPVVNVYGEANGIQYDLVGMPISPEFFIAFVDTDVNVSNKVFVIDSEKTTKLNKYQYDHPITSIMLSKNEDTLRRQCEVFIENRD